MSAMQEATGVLSQLTLEEASDERNRITKGTAANPEADGHLASEKEKNKTQQHMSTGAEGGDNITHASESSNIPSDLPSSARSAPLAPGVKLYEIRQTTDKYFGVFAVQEISCGTRIMSEEPLLTREPREDSLEIPSKFAALPKIKQDLFLALDHTKRPKIDSCRAERRGCEKRFAKAKLTLPSVDQVKILSIFENNRFPKEDCPQCMEDGTKVFTDASRVNHDCLPNAQHAWNNNLGRGTLHATCTIQAGEEILVSYCGLDKTQKMRAKELGT